MSFHMEALRTEVRQFIRLFGLLEQHRTPCGYALSVSQAQALQELREALAGGSAQEHPGAEGRPAMDGGGSDERSDRSDKSGRQADNPAAGMPQSELAARLRLERSTVSRLIDSLVKEGFVARTVNERNRRETLLALTERGERTAQEVIKQSEAFFERVLDGLSEEERLRILDGFRLFGEALRTYERGGQSDDE